MRHVTRCPRYRDTGLLVLWLRGELNYLQRKGRWEPISKRRGHRKIPYSTGDFLSSQSMLAALIPWFENAQGIMTTKGIENR
jgi:hypothetical protein